MKPHDIPQGVWDAADAAMADAANEVARIINSGESPSEDGALLPILARAILAEREACRQIASCHGDIAVAMAIRSRP